MSFYSYKNANSDTCPGVVNGNILSGLNQRVCVQVKNVYDSCMQQEQLDDQRITIENIVPVLPGPDCLGNSGRACACDCDGNRCNCECPPASIPITHDEAVQNAENNPGPLPRPYGAWTFESCRSSTTAGRISNLTVERMTDRPQFARVRCTVDVPLDVLFLDQRCQEWMGQTVIKVNKDILLCIPDDSIIPFTLESLVSAICVDLRIRHLHRQLHLRHHRLRHRRAEGAGRGGHPDPHLRLLPGSPLRGIRGECVR